MNDVRPLHVSRAACSRLSARASGLQGAQVANLLIERWTQEFLIDIQATESVDFNSLAAILCMRAKSNGDAIRLICMRWLRQFVAQAKLQLVERYADILAAVLPCLSHSNPEIVAVRPLSDTESRQQRKSGRGCARVGDSDKCADASCVRGCFSRCRKPLRQTRSSWTCRPAGSRTTRSRCLRS